MNRNSNIKEQPFVYIVSLNWNGETDTIAMLRSLSDVDYANYHIVLIDNGSEHSSYNFILKWLESNECFDFKVDTNEFIEGVSIVGSGQKISFLKSTENLGFAKGSNVGCKYAQSKEGEFVLLLNNDTEVEPNFLTKLMEVYLAKPSLGAVIPQIRYFHNKELIWNCGGKIFFGFRKYFYAGKNYRKLPFTKQINVSFATGCALLFKPGESGLLTEKFFFGEEDFEYAYRMKRMKKEMLCVLDSIIYHKVGQSKQRTVKGVNKGAIFIHYLNRFINMRHQFNNRFVWEVWRFVYSFYIFMLLFNRFETFELIRFIYKLFIRSTQLHGVDKAEFEIVLKTMNVN